MSSWEVAGPSEDPLKVPKPSLDVKFGLSDRLVLLIGGSKVSISPLPSDAEDAMIRTALGFTQRDL